MRPKPKGRPRREATPVTREEEVEREVRRLEAQVAYLKKSGSCVVFVGGGSSLSR